MRCLMQRKLREREREREKRKRSDRRRQEGAPEVPKNVIPLHLAKCKKKIFLRKARKEVCEVPSRSSTHHLTSTASADGFAVLHQRSLSAVTTHVPS